MGGTGSRGEAWRGPGLGETYFTTAMLTGAVVLER